jgi:PAS domain S-box-containing protein
MDQFTEAQKLEFGIGLSGNPVILTNSFSAISWINDFAIKNTGFTKKDCIGLPIQQVIQKLGSDKALDIAELFSSKRSFDFEIEINLVKFSFSCCPIFKEDQSFAGYSIIGTDISHFVLNGSEVQKQNIELQEFFQKSVMPMCITDIEGNFIMANLAYSELFKVQPNALVGRNFLDVHCSHLQADELEMLREEAANTLNPKHPKHTTELSLVDAEGKSIHIEVTRKLVKVNNRMLISVFVNDITETFESRIRITEQNNRLREFAFLTSHKLRQPLANVLGLIDLVKSESQSNKDVTITMETLRMLTGQLDHVVHEMGLVLAELDVEVERSLFYKDQEEGRVEDVWLVDDDQVIAYITERLLRNVDPTVKITSFLSAKMALEKLRIAENTPDLLLLDINMPGINGWEFLDELRNMHRYVNVYMYSSSIDPEDVKKARSYPMVRDFLSKPVDSSVLRRILEMPIIKTRVS